jgi:anti-anti-sigma factor
MEDQPSLKETTLRELPTAFQRIDRAEGRTLIVSGALDSAVMGHLRDQLRALIGEADECALVDLSNVTFVESSCLGALIEAHQGWAPMREVRLVLIDPSPACDQALAISGLTDLFNFA